MNPLRLIPGGEAIAGLVMALAAAGAATLLAGVFHFQPRGERIGEERVRAQWVAAELKRSQIALQAEQEQRALEQQEAAARQEALDEAQRLAARSRAGVSGAARADRVLGDAVAAVVSGGGLRLPTSAAAGSCEAAEEATVVLADVLGRARARLRELGEFADQAHDAGSTCERIADAMTARAELTVGSQ